MTSYKGPDGATYNMNYMKEILRNMVNDKHRYTELIEQCRYYERKYKLTDEELEELYNYVDSIW